MATDTLDVRSAVSSRRSEHFGYLAALGSAAMVGLFTVLNKWLLVASLSPLAAAGRRCPTATGIEPPAGSCADVMAAATSGPDRPGRSQR
jgi:hypothetical protein